MEHWYALICLYLEHGCLKQRAKFPVKVTVAAYQWGRSVEPLVQSAETVARSFMIVK